MKSNSSLVYSLSLVVGDFLALVAAFAGAYILRVSISHRPISTSVSAKTYLLIFLAVIPFWILVFALLGLYNSSIYEKRFKEAGRLLVGSFVGLLFVIGYAYFYNRAVFPARLVPVYGFILAFLFLLIFRTIARYLRSLLFSYDVGITNVLIVGSTKVATELVETLMNSNVSGYRIIGLVGDKVQGPTHSDHIPAFQTFEEAMDKLDSDDIHSIVQTELYASGRRNNVILEFAQSNHIAYRFIPGNTELFVGKLEVELFRSSIPVIAVHQTPLIGWGRIIKRLFDLVTSVLLLIIFSPIFILISLAILILDPGPVIFRNRRITRFNNIFNAYKFRTMKRKYSGREDVGTLKAMGYPVLAEAFRKGQKLPYDPRVSAIGKFLRRTSLDELPQLINVIKGDISLVGPRAVVPEELKFYEDKGPLLLSIKTGITGLAQVTGRSNIDYYERAKLDLYYVQNWSFWMDLQILIKTFKVVLRRSGAR
jgi:exopolysaccharide biosynthesis polyprenyl glycosylphosphotransferase